MRRWVTQMALRNSWALSSSPPAPFIHDARFLYRGLWQVHVFEEWLHDHCKIFPRVESPTLNHMVSPLLQEAKGTAVRGLPASAWSVCDLFLCHRIKQSDLWVKSICSKLSTDQVPANYFLDQPLFQSLPSASAAIAYV